MRRKFQPSPGLPLQSPACPGAHSLAGVGGGGRGPPWDLPRSLQKPAEPLEVPFQLAHVHRGIVGGRVGRIWGDRPTSGYWLRSLPHS